MSFKTIKLLWARKLLVAKYFVILTDKGSAIGFEGIDPHSFEDVLGLASQAAEMQMMHDQLGVLIKEHTSAMDSLTRGAKSEKPNTTRKTGQANKAKTTK